MGTNDPPEGYGTVVFSDIGDRDGLGMELTDSGEEPLLEVFRHDDAGGRLTLTAFTEWLTAVARRAVVHP